MDLRRKRNGSFTGYPFTGVEFKGYPFTGYKFGEDVTGAQLAFIWHGEPTVYSYFTRDGDAPAEEPDESITTVGTDVPAYEYDGGDKLFRQYSGTGTLPFPPATYVTVNPSTLSLLSEDVDRASFLFDPAESDNVDLGRPSALDFTPQVDAFEIEGWFISNNTVDDGTMYSFGAGISVGSYQLLIASLSDGRAFVAAGGQANSIPGLYNTGSAHFIKLRFPASSTGLQIWIDGAEVLSNGNIGSVTSSQNAYYGARTDGLRTLFNGNLWNWSHYSGNGENRVLVAQHNMAQYRRDTLVIDESGNGNNGTASRTIDNLISENDSFGYPVALAAPLKFFKNVESTIYTWTLEANSIASQPAPESSAFYIDGDVTAHYLVGRDIRIDGSILGVVQSATYNEPFSPGNTRVVLTTAVVSYPLTSVEYEESETITTSVKYGIKELFGGVGAADAVGVTYFETYVPYDLTSDLPIIQFETSDFVPLYVEATTGLIKGTDDTNTCVSSSAAVAGSTVSGWFAWNEDEMWITLDGTKGTIATFAGSFPAIGNRVFALTDSTYQTVRNLYFDNELAYELVYLNGEIVTQDGEPVTIKL